MEAITHNMGIPASVNQPAAMRLDALQNITFPPNNKLHTAAAQSIND